MWHSLIANFAVVGLFLATWAHWQEDLRLPGPLVRTAVFGLVTGAGCCATMLMSITLADGIYFDMRSALIALSGFVGGPLAAAVTMTIAALYRVSMLGAAGVPAALVGIASAGTIGVVANLLLRGRDPTRVQTALFALLTCLFALASYLALPDQSRNYVLQSVAIPLLILGPILTYFAARMILQSRRRGDRRRLLTAALSQSPDFVYLKDAQSRFVVANQAVAEIYGLADPRELRGKTDLDLIDRERARKLYADEQATMRSGEGQLEYVERIADATGSERWYATSKAPVQDARGMVIGLTGVTRDITGQKAVESELVASRNQLALVLTEMSDGLALYSGDGHLLFCNEQYRAFFPMTGELRYPGAHMPDILRAAVARGEQLDIPRDRVEHWVAGIMAALKTGADEEVHRFDGRWLHIRTKPLESGEATVVVSDITTIKRAEIELMAMTEQLKLLATTDGLTGLHNRRALDEALDRELLRSQRQRQPLGLILIDIDRFKAFNDHYGHQAGDDCLRRVADTVRHKVRRPADFVARYGGEEFCIILADTDETGTRQVAEATRVAIRDLAIPHLGSELGLVTISAGYATLDASDTLRSANSLIARSDAALYLAKSMGRDVVFGDLEIEQTHPAAEASGL